MTAPTIPAADVDEQTVADIDALEEQPCELQLHVHHGGSCRRIPCNQAAEWSMRSRCPHCGRVELNLICQPHHDLIIGRGRSVNFVCSSCGRSSDPVILSLDRFRCRG